MFAGGGQAQFVPNSQNLNGNGGGGFGAGGGGGVGAGLRRFGRCWVCLDRLVRISAMSTNRQPAVAISQSLIVVDATGRLTQQGMQMLLNLQARLAALEAKASS